MSEWTIRSVGAFFGRGEMDAMIGNGSGYGLRTGALGALLAGGLVLAVFAGTVLGQVQAPAELTPAITAPAEALSGAFRAITAKAKPAVVSITVRSLPGADVKARQEIDPDELPEPLREFFKREFKGRIPRQFDRPAPRSGMGSGVIVDAKNGYIITNNHVIQNAKDENARIEVRLSNGSAPVGKVIGRDPATDLALVQIKADGLNLAELPIGDSERIEVGDLVLAIGAPFGLTQTVTQGIVSATGRNPMIVEGYEDFIQTDAAINPGNSGGPLLNMKGEVIGINTAIVTGGMSAGYMGVGFAVPSATVKELLAQWREGKEIVRGYLGVEIQGLKDGFEPGIGKTYGLDEDKGILVQNVRPGTPAAKAGLKADDVILGYEGRDVSSVPELQRQVARTRPGAKVDLRVWRDNKEITIPVLIEKQPANYFQRRWADRGGQGTPEAQDGGEIAIEGLGMTVAKVTPELAKQYGWGDVKELAGAVIVTEVEPLGEAAAGLKINQGDLILSVQGKAVKSPEDLAEMLSEETLGEGVRLRIMDVETKRTRTLFARTPK